MSLILLTTTLLDGDTGTEYDHLWALGIAVLLCGIAVLDKLLGHKLNFDTLKVDDEDVVEEEEK